MRSAGPSPPVSPTRSVSRSCVSYGGYAVLAGMTRNPETYACGVDVVGPSNLETFIATIPLYWEAICTQLTKAVGDPETEDGLGFRRRADDQRWG